MAKDFRTDPLLVVISGKGGEMPAPWPEPDLSFLPGTQQAKAPNFPLQAMGAASDWIAAAADGAGVYPDYVAAALLAAVGATCGKAFELAINSDWREPNALWLFCIGAPSSGKTPAAKAVRKALDQVEADLRRQHEETVQTLIDESLAENDHERAGELKGLLKQPPRIRVQDSTREQLAHVEARSPYGLLVDRDELAGLLRALEQYSSGVDRPFYLESWNGGAYTVDRRAQDGSIRLEDHLFSLHGGIQPDKLRELLLGQDSDDGFAARALLFWPDVRPRTGIPNGADHSRLYRALGRLMNLGQQSERKKRSISFSEEAAAAFTTWYVQVDYPAQQSAEGKLASAYGKFPGQVARLALGLHLLDWAFGKAEAPPASTVTLDTLQRALCLSEEYFRQQASRVYQGLDISPARAMATAILAAARERGAATFNGRKILREWGLSGGRRKDAVHQRNAALKLLQGAGWTRPINRCVALNFVVNPALFSENIT